MWSDHHFCRDLQGALSTLPALTTPSAHSPDAAYYGLNNSLIYDTILVNSTAGDIDQTQQYMVPAYMFGASCGSLPSAHIVESPDGTISVNVTGIGNETRSFNITPSSEWGFLSLEGVLSSHAATPSVRLPNITPISTNVRHLSRYPGRSLLTQSPSSPHTSFCIPRSLSPITPPLPAVYFPSQILRHR